MRLFFFFNRRNVTIPIQTKPKINTIDKSITNLIAFTLLKFIFHLLLHFFKHLLKAGSTSPDDIVSNFGNAPILRKQDNASSYDAARKKVVFVWIDLGVALAF